MTIRPFSSIFRGVSAGEFSSVGDDVSKLNHDGGH